VLFGRERMILLEPRGNGIIGTTLHYDYEVRDDAAYFESIPKLQIDQEMLDLAAHIIDLKSAKFDPEKFKDRYQEAVADLVRSKQAGRPPPAPHAPQPGNVINLMEALRRSLDAGKGAKGKAAHSERKAGPHKRLTAQNPQRTRGREPRR
jgi:DNA end-binding protein Ku